MLDQIDEQSFTIVSEDVHDEDEVETTPQFSQYLFEFAIGVLGTEEQSPANYNHINHPPVLMRWLEDRIDACRVPAYHASLPWVPAYERICMLQKQLLEFWARVLSNWMGEEGPAGLAVSSLRSVSRLMLATLVPTCCSDPPAASLTLSRASLRFSPRLSMISPS